MGMLRLIRERFSRAGAIDALARTPTPLSDRLCAVAGLIPTPRNRTDAYFARRALGCSPGAARRIAARARANLYRARVDFRRWDRTGARWRPTVLLNGEKHLSHAASGGSGVVIATIHTTALLPAVWTALDLMVARGYRVHGVGGMDPPQTAARQVGFSYTRAHQGSRRGLHTLLTALRSGVLLLVPIDHADTSGAPAVPSRFPTGVATLARLAGAPIVPVLPLRVGPARYTLTILPPVAPPATHGEEETVTELVLGRLKTLAFATPEQCPASTYRQMVYSRVVRRPPRAALLAHREAVAQVQPPRRRSGQAWPATALADAWRRHGRRPRRWPWRPAEGVSAQRGAAHI
ncbi:MAG: hypothetical protein U0531_13210 [Dehalococcoidia bacterium]